MGAGADDVNGSGSSGGDGNNNNREANLYRDET